MVKMVSTLAEGLVQWGRANLQRLRRRARCANARSARKFARSSWRREHRARSRSSSRRLGSWGCKRRAAASATEIGCIPLPAIAERQTHNSAPRLWSLAWHGMSVRHRKRLVDITPTYRTPVTPRRDSVSERTPDTLTLGAHARRTSGHESPGPHLVFPERFLAVTQSLHASFYTWWKWLSSELLSVCRVERAAFKEPIN